MYKGEGLPWSSLFFIMDNYQQRENRWNLIKGVSVAAGIAATITGRRQMTRAALGTLERIHKYHWINKIRGNLEQGTNAYYIALSDDY